MLRMDGGASATAFSKPVDKPVDKRGGFPTRLSDVLPGALERMGPKGVWTEAKVRRAWEVAVGEELAARTEVRRLKGQVLEVDAANETWATQLRYLGSVIVGRLNDVLGPGTVSEIVVRRQGRRRS